MGYLLVVPAELSLPLVGALLVEFSLDLRSLRSLLGDRRLRAAVLRPFAVVTHVLVLRLALHLSELPAVASTTGSRNHNRENDQGTDDYGDDCDGGHRSSFT